LLKKVAANQKDLVPRYSAKSWPQRNAQKAINFLQLLEHKHVNPVIQSIRTFASPLAGITLNCSVAENLKQSSMVPRIMNLKLGPVTGQLSFGRALNRAELQPTASHALPAKKEKP
jgi:hypothetical protein